VEDVKRWLPVVAYAALIIYFSSQSGQSLPRWPVMAHDKILHAAEYGGLGFLLTNALGVRRWWWAVLAAVLFGISDEFHQSFVPGRFGNDVGDLAADTVGATLGALGRVALTRLLRSPAADGTKSP
jgi:VanZ family protein